MKEKKKADEITGEELKENTKKKGKKKSKKTQIN